MKRVENTGSELARASVAATCSRDAAMANESTILASAFHTNDLASFRSRIYGNLQKAAVAARTSHER